MSLFVREQIFCYLLFIILNPLFIFGQESEKYYFGEPEDLQIKVFIMGEVKEPGEYRVSDNTNLVELISKAGGPTEFSDLNEVTVTRSKATLLANSDSVDRVLNKKSKQILKFNVNNYLKKQNTPYPPKLFPGDVIMVPRNKWHKWRNFATIIRDISVIASAYFLYLRSTD